MIRICVIGGGVTGCATARELSKYSADITLIEKYGDVSMGASKANSGIVHAGFDAKPGSLKAKFNVLGNAMFQELSAQLDFPFRRNGAYVLCFEEGDERVLSELRDKGMKNGVKTEILSGEDVRTNVPALPISVKAALYAVTSGITSPYEMTVAYAENACANGVKFVFDTQVEKIDRRDGVYAVTAGGKEYVFDAVVNCAGTHGDQISNQAVGTNYRITARKGEYVLLDKARGDLTEATLFQTPTNMGKGVLVAPTCHGNIIVGPSAVDVTDKDNADTSYTGLTEVFEKARMTIPSLSKRDIITQFTGLRAHEEGDDFVVGRETEGFYNAIGIESPGLTSAPAIAVYLAEMIGKDYGLEMNQNFDGRREGIVRFNELEDQEKAELVNKNPLYGSIVCRCETVTEGEIVDAIHRSPGAKDLDGVKRRTRAGMGRCQAGFCMMRVMEIIARERSIPIESVSKDGRGWIVEKRLKGETES